MSVLCLLFNRLYLVLELGDLFFHLFHEPFVIFYFHIALRKFLDEVPLLYLVLRNDLMGVYQLYPNLRQKLLILRDKLLKLVALETLLLLAGLLFLLDALVAL